MNELDISHQVSERGFAILPPVFTDDEIDALIAAMPTAGGSETSRRRGGERILLHIAAAIGEAAGSPKLLRLVDAIIGSGAFAVRCLLFEKNQASNWLVPWHQDLTIAVKARREIAGWGPWSVKNGAVHVQPPAAILEGMLSVRIHLDRCDAANGPLRVLPGTHRLGRTTPAQIETVKSSIGPVTCAVERGGVMLMKPLLLHASSPCESPGHRRVLHIEYAACALLNGLEFEPGL